MKRRNARTVKSYAPRVERERTRDARRGEEVLDTSLSQTLFVGRVELSFRGAYVVVDRRLLKRDIFVPAWRLNDARNGQKVVVRILPGKRYARCLEGEVVEVLGDSGDNDTEMHAILAEYGLPYSYPDELEHEADTIDADIEEELPKRKDMRAVTTFTIDPYDAKDFDDALSLRVCQVENPDAPLSAGNDEVGDDTSVVYEVGVHIADVTHYVRPDTPLDEEAFRRATSVYLVDRTIPMLPERLSNYICSLRPQEDKLCYSVLFRLNDKAEVLRADIKKTVIRSDRRFTYEEAQQRLDTGEGDYASELGVLYRLASLLRQRRFEKGAVDLGHEEVRFTLDEQARPLAVMLKTAMPANHLVEEFMLLANRTVAERIGMHPAGRKVAPERAFVYRVHDLPDPDRYRSFVSFIRRFGYSLPLPSLKGKAPYKGGAAFAGKVSGALNGLLSEVRNRPERNLVETLAVRSMAKAVYSTDNIGHYGLAFSCYTHFTSPIRRYPDMMVHRLLERYLRGAASVGKDALEERCRHCSDRERLAADAERASIRYKQVEFMQAHIGKEFEGVVSGVTEWGLFVELCDTRCEGMVPVRELDGDDFFFFNEEEYCLESVRSGKRFTLGDSLRVRVVRADLVRRQLDFVLA